MVEVSTALLRVAALRIQRIGQNCPCRGESRFEVGPRLKVMKCSSSSDKRLLANIQLTSMAKVGCAKPGFKSYGVTREALNVVKV